MVFDNDTQGVGMRTLLAGHGMKLPAFTARYWNGKSCELFSRFFCQITVCIFLGIKFLYRCIPSFLLLYHNSGVRNKCRPTFIHFWIFFLFSSKSASMNYNFSGHAYSICLKKYFFAWNASYYLQMDLMITCKFSEVLKSRSTMNSARTFKTWFLRKTELPKYFLLIKNSISSIY